MAVWENVWPVIAALLPSAGLLFLCYGLTKHSLEGDRRERSAQRAWEEERRGAEKPGGPHSPNSPGE